MTDIEFRIITDFASGKPIRPQYRKFYAGDLKEIWDKFDPSNLCDTRDYHNGSYGFWTEWLDFIEIKDNDL